jgi:hypothetical protein
MIINIRPLLQACEDHFVQLDEVTDIGSTVSRCYPRSERTHSIVSRGFCDGTPDQFGVLLSEDGQWAIPFKKLHLLCREHDLYGCKTCGIDQEGTIERFDFARLNSMMIRNGYQSMATNANYLPR